ncbi:hypothetical protein [Herbidospora mongoliensis]|uniref:hypothetical protein n=1 Tax=Herbidospora mongoliensis TaxID=688067 RepID=UPI00082A57C2|nr:hypothetical protein [Herbidospora mongoliensis]
MEDSAEPVPPTDGQDLNPLLIDDRIRDGTQRGRLGKGLMGAVPVVELFVLAQRKGQGNIGMFRLWPGQAAARQIRVQNDADGQPDDRTILTFSVHN